ncbi:hypothetical protein HY041_02570 [Candidatus Roizmanbacteria bacterium]|nr:hypothetical protein [Candidatus Roizmanbacteria bacterium]
MTLDLLNQIIEAEEATEAKTGEFQFSYTDTHLDDMCFKLDSLPKEAPPDKLIVKMNVTTGAYGESTAVGELALQKNSVNIVLHMPFSQKVKESEIAQFAKSSIGSIRQSTAGNPGGYRQKKYAEKLEGMGIHDDAEIIKLQNEYVNTPIPLKVLHNTVAGGEDLDPQDVARLLTVGGIKMPDENMMNKVRHDMMQKMTDVLKRRISNAEVTQYGASGESGLTILVEGNSIDVHFNENGQLVIDETFSQSSGKDTFDRMKFGLSMLQHTIGAYNAYLGLDKYTSGLTIPPEARKIPQVNFTEYSLQNKDIAHSEWAHLGGYTDSTKNDLTEYADQLTGFLDPASGTTRPSNLLLEGVSGIGKTATMRCMIRELLENRRKPKVLGLGEDIKDLDTLMIALRQYERGRGGVLVVEDLKHFFDGADDPTKEKFRTFLVSYLIDLNEKHGDTHLLLMNTENVGEVIGEREAILGAHRVRKVSLEFNKTSDGVIDIFNAVVASRLTRSERDKTKDSKVLVKKNDERVTTIVEQFAGKPKSTERQTFYTEVMALLAKYKYTDETTLTEKQFLDFLPPSVVFDTISTIPAKDFKQGSEILQQQNLLRRLDENLNRRIQNILLARSSAEEKMAKSVRGRVELLEIDTAKFRRSDAEQKRRIKALEDVQAEQSDSSNKDREQLAKVLGELAEIKRIISEGGIRSTAQTVAKGRLGTEEVAEEESPNISEESPVTEAKKRFD